jgi:UDP-3-O-[3-hydroxymyristoyl] N-acetylglucosamine deacetylase
MIGKKLGNWVIDRFQRTIARAVDVQGVGILTGAKVRLRFYPAPPSTGVVFIRTDLPKAVQIPARLDQVSGTQRRTTLGRPPAQVGMVEHVLAALAGSHIDNCRIEINAADPPGLDGSSQGYVDALTKAGVVLQPARRAIWTVEQAVIVVHDGATLALHPSPNPGLRVSYILHYGWFSPVGWQIHTQTLTAQSFASELAHCRTFILESEAAELRRQGLGQGLTNADLLVFGPAGPVGNRLHHADEPARHKILDMVGDLSLLGHDLHGHLVGYRSGHTLNIELGRTLQRQLISEVDHQPQAA